MIYVTPETHDQLHHNLKSVKKRADHALNELSVSLDKFSQAEIQFTWTRERYVAKYGDTTDTQFALDKDLEYRQAIADCAYYRDRATMFATACTTFNKRINDLTATLVSSNICWSDCPGWSV